MKNILLTFFACGVLFCSHTSIGQSRFSRSNQLAIDKAKAEITKSCGAFGSSKEASSSQIKADKKLIEFFNEFYNKDLSKEEIIKKLDPFFKHKWQLEAIDLGGLVKYETKIYPSGNLRCSIAFSVFQNEIVFKKIFIETISRTNCIGNPIGLIDFVDFNYLDISCLPLIDFPLNLCASCGIVQSDLLFDEKIKKYQGAQYKFSPSDSVWLNNIVWHSDDTYNMEYPEKEIVMLTKNHNTNLLNTLLYSPNHIVAIQSMEALTFLDSTEGIHLPADLQQKMDDIKSSAISIRWQYSDVVRSGKTYKDLNISKEKIVAKYNQAIEKIK